MILIPILVCIIFFSELLYYLFFPPVISGMPVVPCVKDAFLGKALYSIAYILSILRLPFEIFPSILTVLAFMIFTSQKHYIPFQKNNFEYKHYKTFLSQNFQAGIRVVGSIVSFIVTTKVILVFTSLVLPLPLCLICYSVIWAEATHLLPMQWQELFSILWQHIPHKKIASLIKGTKHPFLRVLQKPLTRYCFYYSLEDEEKAKYVLTVLRYYASRDREMTNRLAYLSSFCIVDDNHYLIGGNVRDVASGKVFIHKSWTRDPWLISALAIRRAPWIFDPRYIQRPFYYRSESYRAVTVFLFCRAHYYFPYVIYQFGHCVKNAYYEPLYKALRWIGINMEVMVNEDGSYAFVNPVIQWLEKLLQRFIISNPEQHPLWSDTEVMTDVLQKLRVEGRISAFSIASRYTYPVKYIEEVLLDKIVAASYEYTVIETDNEGKVLCISNSLE